MVKLKIKSLFFDSAKVMREADRKTRKALSKAGAFIRQRAKTSIRKRKKTSAPGKPPSSHTGLMRKIFFSYGPDTQSVIIGPMKLSQKVGNAPEALEHGGSTTVVVRKGGKRVNKRVTVKARPFMGPAMADELPNLPKRWRNSVRG